MNKRDVRIILLGPPSDTKETLDSNRVSDMPKLVFLLGGTCGRRGHVSGIFTRKQFNTIWQIVYDGTSKLTSKSLVPGNGTRKVNRKIVVQDEGCLP